MVFIHHSLRLNCNEGRLTCLLDIVELKLFQVYFQTVILHNEKQIFMHDKPFR